MYVWGVSVDQSLGIANTDFSLATPTLIPNVNHIINVFSGNDSTITLAQTRTGVMYAWGKGFG